MQSDEIRFTICSTPEAVALVTTSVAAVCRARGVDGASLVELAIAEALNNIVEHAYEGRGDDVIEVLMRVDAHELRFEIVDAGVSSTAELARLMSEAVAPEFDLHDRSTLPEGGMGLALIRSVMDTVDVTRRDERNRLLLIRKLVRDE